MARRERAAAQCPVLGAEHVDRVLGVDEGVQRLRLVAYLDRDGRVAEPREGRDLSAGSSSPRPSWTDLYAFIRSSRGSLADPVHRSGCATRLPVHTRRPPPKTAQARSAAPTLCGNFGSMRTTACIA